jgi:PAS domain S-box-containing protein
LPDLRPLSRPGKPWVARQISTPSVKRVQPEKHLPDDHGRYRDLVEFSPDGILVLRDDRVVFANSSAARLVGAVGPDELLSKTLLDFFHPASYTSIGEHLTRWLAGAAGPPFDAKLARMDGGTLDVEVVGGHLNDHDSRTVQMIVRENGERKRIEAALRENEERLTLAFAGAQEGVWDWNLETGAVVYSSRWKQMLGYSDDEIEPHVSAWERLLHPDDSRRARQIVDGVARGELDYRVEFRLRHKEGHWVDILSRGFPIRREHGGPVVRIVGTHLDVTERNRAEAALRESEERLTLAFAGAQEGVWDWNLETGAVVYSTQWKQMLGYDDDEIEPHVSAWERLLHPDDRQRAQEVNERVARGGQTYEGEFRLRHKNGDYLHVLSRGFPVRREPGGTVVRIVGTHFDLTERKQGEEALRRAHEELEQRVLERTAELAHANASLRAEISERERAERARVELLARLVFAQEDERRRIAREMHDQFGEQLTALGHGIGLLKDACHAEEGLRDQVAALAAIAQQLDRDVDHLVWELRPTALDDLGLRAALTNYVQDWSRRVSIPAQLHTSGLMDDRLPSEIETTLFRIAQEALTNIAKHSHAKNVEVILERRGDAVLLIIEDDGVGFDSSDADAGGQGFGLIGMHERAALVGATLQIESAVGKGTTIFLRTSASAPAASAALS